MSLMRTSAARLEGWGGLALLAVCMSLGVWAVSGSSVFRDAPMRRVSSRARAADRIIRDEPLHVAANVSLPGLCDSAEIEIGLARLESPKPSSLSNMLHVLHLFGRDEFASFVPHSRKEELLNIILDAARSQSYFGEPTFIDTRDGIRCRVVQRFNDDAQPEREAHSDQLLAVLAELGVPLSREISTNHGKSTVRQLLKDSIANFDFAQTEIEWSAAAYALFLPPQNQWVDKYGAAHTFDDLAGELLSRSYDQQPACGGTHLLYALALLLRVDTEQQILSSEMRHRVHDRLKSTVDWLVRTQQADGSWKVKWYDESPAVSRLEWRKVLVTGHHMEWLVLLPSDLAPPDECIARAARWLQFHLLSDPQEQMKQHYCPYSHACHVLLVLGQRTEKTPLPGDSADGVIESFRNPGRVSIVELGSTVTPPAVLVRTRPALQAEHATLHVAGEIAHMIESRPE